MLTGLELDLGAQGVDVWRGSGIHLVGCLIVDRLRRLDLGVCRFNAGFVGDGLQIGVADGQHNQVAGVLESIASGFQTLARRAGSVD